MRKNELQQHAEKCQLEADNFAFLFIKAKKLMEFQSLCEFNVFWLHDVSPVIFHIETVEFFLRYKSEFKRKITVKEFIRYDGIVVHFSPQSFDEFRKML